LNVKRCSTAVKSSSHLSVQFVVVAKKVVKTIVTTKKEDIEVALAVEREPWQLPKSIFASRAKRGPQQCDAKDYFDTEKVFASMFEIDWACLKSKVPSLNPPRA
jgi:hypothetical protein